MIYRKIFLILILTTNSLLYAQERIMELNINDLPQSKFTRSEIFDGTSLWGYINGGADIYLEYGFVNVLVQEFEWKNYKFKVDFYKMDNPKAAFGIYSISTFNCSFSDSLTEFACVTSFQVQLAIGDYYIQIVNEKGDYPSTELNKKIAKIILQKYSGFKLELPALFLSKAFKPFLSTLKYLQGKLGIQNGLPDWEVYFEKITDYSLYVLPAEVNGKRYSLALINFSVESDCEVFKNCFEKTSNRKTKLWEINPKLIVFLELDKEIEESELTASVEQYLKSILQKK
jgi:hypothetical protein